MMTHSLTSEKCCIYPGEFIPRADVEEMALKLEAEETVEIGKPSVNIIEDATCFRIEMPVPGVEREDFFIHARGNILTVTVSQKESKDENGFMLSEFTNNHFQRHIILPENVAAVLGQAEYRSGILYMYLPKNGHLLQHKPAKIPVY